MASSHCPICKQKQQHSEDWVRCEQCQTFVFRDGGICPILVVSPSPDICQLTGEILYTSGFRPTCIQRAVDHARVSEEIEPRATVLDVATQDVLFFQLIDEIRANLDEHKIILLASVYNKTAYKRTPSTLYGADDYVEQHHIPDKLPQKLQQMLNIQAEELDLGKAAGQLARIRDKLEKSEQEPEQAQVIAHNVVSDIALYNQEQISQAIQSGIDQQLLEVLDEGFRILEERVGSQASLKDIRAAFKSIIDTYKPPHK